MHTTYFHVNVSVDVLCTAHNRTSVYFKSGDITQIRWTSEEDTSRLQWLASPPEKSLAEFSADG